MGIKETINVGLVLIRIGLVFGIAYIGPPPITLLKASMCNSPSVREYQKKASKGLMR
jgi:hypothetical protein